MDGWMESPGLTRQAAEESDGRLDWTGLDTPTWCDGDGKCRDAEREEARGRRKEGMAGKGKKEREAADRDSVASRVTRPRPSLPPRACRLPSFSPSAAAFLPTSPHLAVVKGASCPPVGEWSRVASRLSCVGVGPVNPRTRVDRPPHRRVSYWRGHVRL